MILKTTTYQMYQICTNESPCDQQSDKCHRLLQPSHNNMCSPVRYNDQLQNHLFQRQTLTQALYMLWRTHLLSPSFPCFSLNPRILSLVQPDYTYFLKGKFCYFKFVHIADNKNVIFALENFLATKKSVLKIELTRSNVFVQTVALMIYNVTRVTIYCTSLT